MKSTIVVVHSPRSFATPGWKGGPAPLASLALTYLFLGRYARFLPPLPVNDNGGAAA